MKMGGTFKERRVGNLYFTAYCLNSPYFPLEILVKKIGTSRGSFKEGAGFIKEGSVGIPGEDSRTALSWKRLMPSFTSTRQRPGAVLFAFQNRLGEMLGQMMGSCCGNLFEMRTFFENLTFVNRIIHSLIDC